MNIFRWPQIFILGSLVIGGTGAARAALAISEIPLFLRAGTTPNIVMTIDDSGSMNRGYVPDMVGDTATRRNSPRFTAASYNAMYYNPALTYTVPVRSDGVVYSTSFTNAYVNGFDTSKGVTNLDSNGYRPIYQCLPSQSRSTCVGTSYSTPGAGGGTTTTVKTYSYTCKAFFDDRGSSNDRIELTNCTPSMPNSGDGSPGEADGSKITISGTNDSYSKVYTLSSVSDIRGGGVRISLPNRTQISSDATRNTAKISWTETDTVTVTAGPAYYHMYYSEKPGASRPANCNNNIEESSCYIYIKVGSADDIYAGSSAAQKQNFAIWYSFYRTRALATISAAVNAVSSLSSNQVRLGWQTLNDSRCIVFSTTCRGYDDVNRENRIRTLDALKTGSTTKTHRTDFYEWITRLSVSGATPLRGALKRAGEYFSITGKDSPYAEEPYVQEGTQLSCRRNFHLMLTDGLWNSNENVNYGGNVDSTAKTLPDGTPYTAKAPFADGKTVAPSGFSYSNSLADIAFDYWAKDLVGLSNNLQPFITDRSGTSTDQYWNPRNNPAKWQHMVNFFVSFGLGGALVDPAWGGSTFLGDYSALASGAKSWLPVDVSAAGSESPEDHVYDLWHAAINSRGEFLNAENPAGVAQAFQSVFNSILTKNPSSAALAANSTSIQSGTMIYQAKYESADWRGQLLAYGVNADGSVGPLRWDASTKIPAAASRQITTWNGSVGKALENCSSSLNSTQKGYLDNKPGSGVTLDNKCAERLAWLRGDTSKEVRNGGTFRNRPMSVLGDIINSDPAYVKDQDYGYVNSSMAEKSSYAAFLTSKENRLPMVYVGANDGMLHGFRADAGATDSGKELLAHIPAGVYSRLNQLMDPSYSHKYYVDAPPSVGDAYLSGSWKSVLVSGLAAGGKSVFALDVTRPDTYSASNVLWEFTDTQDLGYTYSQPQIGRLASGHWVAIFGNGYNSTGGKASLFVVNLADGTLLKKIQVSTTLNNGLSSPVLFDTNNDKIIDVVYAGDLQGNLWKFDLTASTADGWTVANNKLPLFIAKNASNQVQAITTKPVVEVSQSNPTGGAMVLFGTGSYLTDTDPANTQVQSFYGIWDNNVIGSVVRSQLQAQSISAETKEYGFDLRETTNNQPDWSTKRGWYLDLVGPNVATSGVGSERIVANPIVRYDRVIFVTTIPTSDLCEPGGNSWLMEVDFKSGARTEVTPFDFNGDNLFNAQDLLASGRTASGVKSPEGILRTPTWLEQSRTSEVAVKQISGSSGGIFTLSNRKPAYAGAVRRIFWQQIR